MALITSDLWLNGPDHLGSVAKCRRAPAARSFLQAVLHGEHPRVGWRIAARRTGECIVVTAANMGCLPT